MWCSENFLSIFFPIIFTWVDLLVSTFRDARLRLLYAYLAGIFDVDSMLNRRRNFNGRRKSVEKRKNISTVVEKALKFQRSLKFRRWFDVDISMVFYSASKKRWKLLIVKGEVCSFCWLVWRIDFALLVGINGRYAFWISKEVLRVHNEIRKTLLGKGFSLWH